MNNVANNTRVRVVWSPAAAGDSDCGVLQVTLFFNRPVVVEEHLAIQAFLESVKVLKEVFPAPYDHGKPSWSS